VEGNITQRMSGWLAYARFSHQQHLLSDLWFRCGGQ
jgi:hypothetical protein